MKAEVGTMNEQEMLADIERINMEMARSRARQPKVMAAILIIAALNLVVAVCSVGLAISRAIQ